VTKFGARVRGFSSNKGIKEGYTSTPLTSSYFTAIGSPSMKTVADSTYRVRQKKVAP